MTIRSSLLERARRRRARVALAEGDDPRVVEAARRLEREGLADVVVVTESDVASHFRRDAIAEHLVRRRPERFSDVEAARERAANSVWLSAGLVALGDVDAAVAGAVAPTAEVVRAALTLVGTAPRVSLVSSSFYMIAPDHQRVLNFTDCGVVPTPTPEQLAQIALSAVDARARLFGDEPRVAFLSYSTKGSASGDRIEHVREGLRLFRSLAPEIAADGELQGDAALNPDVATRKAPGSPLAGKANILVFPDLDSGNIAYKLVQHLGGWTALGPILQGLAKPVCDLSRGASVDDIVDVAVIAALLAGDGE